MKQKIVNAFEEITMPESCEQKIRRAMADRQQKRHVRRKLALMTATLILVVAVTACASPAVRSAAEEVLRKYVFREIGITVWEKENGRIVHFDTESPPFAQVREGRLYFTGNGENMDITDQIAEDKPFIYTYQDDAGMEIALVVGYEGKLEEFGTYQFLRYPDGAWFTGVGRHDLNPETERRYPWVDIVWEQLDIPWPIPG